MNSFLNNLDFSVAVEPSLKVHHFYRKEEGLITPGYQKRSKEQTPLTAAASLRVLVEHTGLKFLRTYYSYRSIYLYIANYKCYFKINPEDLSVIVSRIFGELSLPDHFTANTYLDNIVKCAFVNYKVSYLGDPQNDIKFNLVAVSNGVLDLNTGLFLDPSPEIFVVNFLSYAYLPEMKTPYFDYFLEHITDGVEEKKRFLMGSLNVVVRGKPELHSFIYLYGNSGTGKTSFTNLCNALVGNPSTHATTLAALINDQFEAINIEGKKLIIIGDTDSYVKDIGPLKALTGGDPVRGRVMYSNVTRDVVLKGTMIITGNHLLNVLDDSGAFMRRCRPYKMSKVPDSKLDMLSRDHKGGWQGVLGPELPGILGKVVLTPHEDVVKYVGNFHEVEALKEGLEETADILNPLRLFVREALEKGEGAFLGLKPKGEKETRDFASRLMLYPTYLHFQYTRGLSLNVSHKTFTTLLMSACKELGIKLEKVRKPSGIYIEGIMVRPNYYKP